MNYCRLDPMETWLRGYFHLPNDHCWVGFILWLAHVRILHECEVSPRLFLSSARPGSGKSNLLRMASFLAGAEGREGRISGSISAAVLARGYQGKQGKKQINTFGADLCPIFIDEVDKKYQNVKTEDVATTEILNSGFSRGAFYERMGGKKNDEVLRFGIFGAVAMAGLKRAKLPDALRTRTLTIPMDRALKKDKHGLHKFRERIVKAQYKEYRDDLAEFCRYAEGQIRLDDVEFPDGLADRDEDVWEILLAIAKVAGPDWLDRARAAAQWFAAERAGEEEEDRSILMLRDCRELLEHQRAAEPDWLRQQLFNKEGSPWGAWNLTTYQMKGILSDLYIKPKTVRVTGHAKPSKGFHINQFEDALLKYACGAAGYIGHNGHTVDTEKENENKDVTDVTNVTDFEEEDAETAFEERAASLEYEGGLSRQEAEARALADFPELPACLDRRRAS
jgi:hypothetical protein